jgi:hypothetical protein
MARAVYVASGTADSAQSAGTLVGLYVRESAGTPAAAEVVIRNGTTATDPIVYRRELATNENHVVSLPGVDCSAGIFVDRVAGETELVLYVL